MAPILSSVAVIRVRFIRSVNNVALATKGLIATPTVSRLTVPGQHGFIDLEAVPSKVGLDGIGYFDLVATDDADVNETYGWTITGDGWTGFTRTVAVPQSGGIVETIADADGNTILGVWLNQLADFTGSSGPTGPDAATRTYVDDSLDQHEAAVDPHPTYALDSDVTGRLLPTTGSDGQTIVRQSGAWVAGAAAGGGDLPEHAATARTTADSTATNLLGKTTRYDTTSAAITQPLPPATAGRVLAVGWDAGANALTLARDGTDVIGSGSATSLVLPLPGEVLTLHCTTAGRWRVTSGFKPQSALDARLAGLAQWAGNPDALIVGAITRDANGAATSAGVVWPDGTVGTYTADTVSTAFPGAVDAYRITYGSPPTKTYTQSAVTRNALGAVTQRPAIGVS